MQEDPQLDLTDESMEKLSEAIDTLCDPPPPPDTIVEHVGANGRVYRRTIAPNRPGTHDCLRCGWRWTPHSETLEKGGPRSCPFCHSSYWNIEPRLPHARRPSETDWELERQRAAEECAAQTRWRQTRRVARAANKIGLVVIEPESGKPPKLIDVRKNTPSPTKLKARIAELEDMLSRPSKVIEPRPPQSENVHSTLDAEYLRQRAYGRTVPPPPGAPE